MYKQLWVQGSVEIGSGHLGQNHFIYYQNWIMWDAKLRKHDMEVQPRMPLQCSGGGVGGVVSHNHFSQWYL